MRVFDHWAPLKPKYGPAFNTINVRRKYRREYRPENVWYVKDYVLRGVARTTHNVDITFRRRQKVLRFTCYSTAVASFRAFNKSAGFTTFLYWLYTRTGVLNDKRRKKTNNPRFPTLTCWSRFTTNRLSGSACSVRNRIKLGVRTIIPCTSSIVSKVNIAK